jgi:hypothetical protein
MMGRESKQVCEQYARPLAIALTRLAKHYGLIAPDDAAVHERSGLRHWGTGD